MIQYNLNNFTRFINYLLFLFIKYYLIFVFNAKSNITKYLIKQTKYNNK